MQGLGRQVGKVGWVLGLVGLELGQGVGWGRVEPEEEQEEVGWNHDSPVVPRFCWVFLRQWLGLLGWAGVVCCWLAGAADLVLYVLYSRGLFGNAKLKVWPTFCNFAVALVNLLLIDLVRDGLAFVVVGAVGVSSDVLGPGTVGLTGGVSLLVAGTCLSLALASQVWW